MKISRKERMIIEASRSPSTFSSSKFVMACRAYEDEIMKLKEGEQRNDVVRD